MYIRTLPLAHRERVVVNPINLPAHPFVYARGRTLRIPGQPTEDDIPAWGVFLYTVRDVMYYSNTTGNALWVRAREHTADTAFTGDRLRMTFSRHV
jgi:hypothetical protein